MFITFEMWIFFLQKHMDSLQEAIIHPPELCEAHFIIDVHGLFYVFWTVEQKHPPTAMITSQITYVTMVPPREQVRCVERYGECHQRHPALNHMCNQSKLMTRRQVRVTSQPGCLKACEVQPAPASRN